MNIICSYYMPKRREFIKKAILAGIAAEFGSSISGWSDLLAHTVQANHGSNPNKEPSDFWAVLRNEFLVNQELTYLNTSTLGRSPKRVIESIVESTYELEEVVKAGHKKTGLIRNNVASFFNADPKEIAFTANATAGMNLVAFGLDLKKDDEIILTKHEHVGGSMPWTSAANKTGSKITTIDLDLSGETNFDRITSAISDKTKVVIFSHVTCTNGMVLPAKEIAARCKELGVYCCIDGAQSAGMMPIDVSDIDADFYIMCGHKWMFGPKGTGILHIAERNLNKLGTDHVGAYSDSNYNQSANILELKGEASRYEFGTRNTPILCGLNTAIDFLEEIGIDKIHTRGIELTSFLRTKLTEIGGVEILTPGEGPYSASVLTFRIPNRSYQEIQKSLFRKFKIRVRGIYENKLDAIRVSCACYNNKEQLTYLANALDSICSE